MENKLFLAIETSTSVCSVVLARGEKVIAERKSEKAYEHSKVLTPFIEDILLETGLNKEDIDAIILSNGPGSYTGLRIGASVAKGLAYALDIPVITVNTLQSMANGIWEYANKHTETQNFTIQPMIDARRMEVYSMKLDKDLTILEDTRAIILDRAYFESKKQLTFIASDKIEKIAELCQGIHNIRILDDFELSAKHLLKEGLRKYANDEFADTAYFTPFYLKEYIAGIPRVKGLH